MATTITGSATARTGSARTAVSRRTVRGGVLTALAVTLMLGASACDGSRDDGSGRDGSGTGTTSASDSGGTTTAPTTSEAPSDGGGDAAGPSDPATADSPRRVVLSRLFGPDEYDSESTTWALPGDLAAAALAEQVGAEGGATASCEGALTYDDSAAPIPCHATIQGEAGTAETDFTAYPVLPQLPVGADPAPMIMFVSGAPLPDEVAARFITPNIVTGLGLGSMFGAEEVGPGDLAERVGTVLAHDGVEGAPTVTSCASGLAANATEPVTCTGRAGDKDVELTVMFAPLFDGTDGGLVVAYPFPG